MEKGADIDVGNTEYSGHEALVIFDDVFVPNERVFMCGEYEFAGMLVERFARLSPSVVCFAKRVWETYS